MATILRRGAVTRQIARVSPSTSATRRAPSSLGECVGWSIVAVMVLLAGLQIWGGQLQLPGVLWLSLVLILIALASLSVIWTRMSVGRILQVILLIAAVSGFAATVTLVVLGNPTYGTDEIAFDQYAAMMALHGVNPYAHSMAPSLSLFNVPDIFRTFLLNGHVVSRLSYPAGSFLAYFPSLLLGMHMQAAIVTDSVAWVIAMVLAWWLLPHAVAWIAPLLLIAQVYIGYSAGGVTDTLYLPFLVIGLWRWDRYGDESERSWARWVGPVAVGLACSIKQTPWFIVPFLVAGTCFEASQRGQRWWVVGGRYLAITIGVFTAVNLPYIVSDPLAWARSVVVPLTIPTEPGGQGLIGLTLFEQLGGQLRYYTWAGAAAICTAFGAFIGWYRTFKRSWPFMVALAFFWPTRSFGSYLIMLLPVALIAATSVRGVWQCDATFAKVARRGCAITGILGAVCVFAAVTQTPTLALHVLSEGSTGELQSVDSLTIQVENSSSHSITPHYAVTPTGQISSFWNVVSGPFALGPHSSARVTIEAPNFQSMPSISNGFIVDAFTASPAQMATAREVRLDQIGTVLSPEDVNAPRLVGETTAMKIQLIDRFGNDIHRAGVMVDLGQVVYEQSGLQFGEASINGGAEGRTPVSATTNALGVATFEVKGVQAQNSPTFFQGWIIRASRPPLGYSNTVSIQFVTVIRHRG